MKTPTAAAAFLIDHLKATLISLDQLQERVLRHTRQKLSYCEARLAVVQEALPRLFSTVRTRHEARLDSLLGRLHAAVRQTMTESRTRVEALQQALPLLAGRRLMAESHRLQLLEERAKGLDPKLLLSRGYSITLKDGKAVRDARKLSQGDEIETLLNNGTIKSVVR